MKCAQILSITITITITLVMLIVAVMFGPHSIVKGDDPDIPYPECDGDNYDRNGPYAKGVKQVVDYVAGKTPEAPGYDLEANTDSTTPPVIYAKGTCNTFLNKDVDACLNCMLYAGKNVMKLCGGRAEGKAVSNQCAIAFQNYSFHF